MLIEHLDVRNSDFVVANPDDSRTSPCRRFDLLRWTRFGCAVNVRVLLLRRRGHNRHDTKHERAQRPQHRELASLMSSRGHFYLRSVLNFPAAEIAPAAGNVSRTPTSRRTKLYVSQEVTRAAGVRKRCRRCCEESCVRS